jgi:hypothetical protein
MSLYRFDPQNFALKLLNSIIVTSPNMRLFLGVSKVPSLHLHTHFNSYRECLCRVLIDYLSTNDDGMDIG